MMCTGCDEECEVDAIKRQLEPEGTQVYIALGNRPVAERKQIPEEKIAVLQEYFQQQYKSLKTGIKIVFHKMVKSIGSCYAEMVKDADALFAATLKREYKG